MTLGIAKEMADRLIEFTIKMFKGESVEDQLTKAIKAIGLMFALSLFVNFSMFLANVNLRMELNASQANATNFKGLFQDGPKSAMRSIMDVNNTTTEQMKVVKDQVYKSNLQSTHLMLENTFLKRTVLILAQDRRQLTLNNNVLLRQCKP